MAFKISFLLLFSVDFAFKFTPLIVKFDGDYEKPSNF